MAADPGPDEATRELVRKAVQFELGEERFRQAEKRGDVRVVWRRCKQCGQRVPAGDVCRSNHADPPSKRSGA